MKNRICSMLVILFAVLALYGCTEQTKEPEVFEPRPLVLEMPERNYHGTIVVYAEGVKSFDYAGYIEIVEDGYSGQDVEVHVYAGDGGAR